MLRIFKISIFLSLLCFSGQLYAQNKLVTNLSIFYLDEAGVRNVPVNGVDQTLKAQETRTLFGAGLCYAFDSFCLGIKYAQYDIETKASLAGTESESKTSIKGLGLSLGYTSDTFVAHAVWLLNASKSIDAQDLRNYGGTGTDAIEFPAKSGYIIDVGYGFKVASVRVGPLLSVMNFNYTKAKYQGTTYTLPKTEKDDLIVPQLALWMDL